MKAQCYSIFLAIHVAGGFTALVTGLLVLIARKAGAFHKTTGMVYYWGMAIVFITTLILLGLQPGRENLWFLGAVGIVSFYQTFTGRLRVKKKLNAYKVGWIDRISLGLVVLTGFACLAAAFHYFSLEDWFRLSLFLFFATIAFTTAFEDIKIFQGKPKPEHANWVAYHAARMIGSYAATVTAFVVNVVPRHLPEETPMVIFLLLWIAPGVLIGFFGGRMQKREILNRKMNLAY